MWHQDFKLVFTVYRAQFQNWEYVPPSLESHQAALVEICFIFTFQKFHVKIILSIFLDF